MITMMLNGQWHRCCGLGGSTRRLHQSFKGGEIASTRIVRTESCIRHGSTVIALKKIDANDNFAPVAMAA